MDIIIENPKIIPDIKYSDVDISFPLVLI